MTADEWDSSTHVTEMLDSIQHVTSDRKYYLFARGCCSAAKDLSPEFAKLAEKYEQRANDPGKATETGSLFGAILQTFTANPLLSLGLRIPELFAFGQAHAWWTAKQTALTISLYHTYMYTRQGEPNSVTLAQAASLTAPFQAELLRDLVGNPYRPVEFDARWRTETAVAIARTLEEDHAWDRLPILADALQDAGCEDERILSHCREQEMHHLGCWVIDEILRPTCCPQ